MTPENIYRGLRPPVLPSLVVVPVLPVEPVELVEPVVLSVESGLVVS